MAKFTVTFKCPDAVSDALNDAAAAEWSRMKEQLGETFGLIEQHLDYGMFNESFVDKLSKETRRWLRHDEYVTIEFDTDKGTATVLEAT